MGEERLVLLRLRCPPQDDPEVGRMLEAVARATAATGVQLALRPVESSAPVSYAYGEVGPDADRLALYVTESCEAIVSVEPGGDRLAMVAPLVREALAALLESRWVADEARILRGALDMTSSAILLFDAGGAIVYANPRGDDLLSRQTEASLQVAGPGSSPSPLVGHVCRIVERVVASDSETRSWRGSLTLTDGSIMACEILAVRGAADTPGALAILQPVVPLPEQSLETFTRYHQLSPREEEVVRLLLEGLGTSSIADRLSISRHTVRDHLKHVYRKTATRSRGELVSLVAGASSPPPNL